MKLERIIEIYGTEFNGEWIEVHVDATEERYVMEVFTQAGTVSAAILNFAKEKVSKINC